tara:strand:- start:667 stop:1371 length:705 start_codon:yes stop_codon:yes gene_type:complete
MIIKTSKTQKIILALDFDSESETLDFVEKLEPKLCRLKIGKQLFVREGPGIVTSLINRGFDVFLDLKFHDIPNTVVKACKAAADMGCWMINIHACGGRKMMEAVADSFAKLKNPPLLISVTVLTSFDDQEMKRIGLYSTIDKQAGLLAKLSYDSGLDGVVCSALEIKNIRESVGSKFIYVTPGIRFLGDATHDQSRVVTPEKAILLGSDYIVIGRSITNDDDPLKKLKQINLNL